MNKKWVLDWAIIFVALAIAWIGWFYLGEGPVWPWLVLACVLVVFLFFLLSVADSKRKRPQARPLKPLPPAPDTGGITRLILLGDEDDTECASWDLYGKTALLIGRDVGENQVDVNLNGVTYASMIDVEHAALNYASGSWYIEDAGSKNGIAVQKAEDGKKYRLAADQPCRLGKGDILFIGLTRLAIR